MIKNSEVDIDISFIEKTKYSIDTYLYSNHGSITNYPLSSWSGERVYFTVTPDPGYYADIILRADSDVKLKYEGNNIYSFIMPPYNVLINVGFSKNR